jgi:hypothetical protein
LRRISNANLTHLYGDVILCSNTVCDNEPNVVAVSNWDYRVYIPILVGLEELAVEIKEEDK